MMRPKKLRKEKRAKESTMKKKALNELAKYAILAGLYAYRGAISRNTANADAYFKRVSAPKIGDVVVEISSIAMTTQKQYRVTKIARYDDWLVRIGELVEVKKPPQTIQTVYTIRTPDGRQLEWRNCQFIVLPGEP